MHKRYIVRRRARFQSNSGPVNLPYGTAVECREGFLFWKNKQLCAATSQNAKDYFVQDDDWLGQERAMLINTILARLGPQEARKGRVAERWKKYGLTRFASAISARSMRSIGSGMMTFTMRPWMICGTLQGWQV